jgi:hypothetical protein
MLRRLTTALALIIAGPCVARAQTVRFGLHYGFNLSDGRFEDPRFGAQAELHLVGPLQAAAAFSRLSNWPDAQGYTGSAWQASWTLRVRPHGSWSFASMGYGIALLHSNLRNPTFQIDTSATDLVDAAVLGLEVPSPYVRPFADLYLIGILRRRVGFGANLLMGLQIPLPSRSPR